MESNNEKKGRFPKNSGVYASVLIRVKRIHGGKDINISINPLDVIIILVLNFLIS